MSEAKAKEEDPFKGMSFFRSRFSGLTVVANSGTDAEVSERFSPHAVTDCMGDVNRVGFLATKDEAIVARCHELCESGDVVEMDRADWDKVLEKAEPMGFPVG